MREAAQMGVKLAWRGMIIRRTQVAFEWAAWTRGGRFIALRGEQ